MFGTQPSEVVLELLEYTLQLGDDGHCNWVSWQTGLFDREVAELSVIEPYEESPEPGTKGVASELGTQMPEADSPLFDTKGVALALGTQTLDVLEVLFGTNEVASTFGCHKLEVLKGKADKVGEPLDDL